MNVQAGESIIDTQGTLALPPAAFAPRPKTMADTGLSAAFIGELIETHFHDAGVLTLPAFSQRCALAGPDSGRSTTRDALHESAIATQDCPDRAQSRPTSVQRNSSNVCPTLLHPAVGD